MHIFILPSPFDDLAMLQFSLLVDAKHQLVTAGRNLRTIGNIPFAKKVDYILKPARTLDPYEAEVIQNLLNASTQKR